MKRSEAGSLDAVIAGKLGPSKDQRAAEIKREGNATEALARQKEKDAKADAERERVKSLRAES